MGQVADEASVAVNVHESEIEGLAAPFGTSDNKYVHGWQLPS